MTKRHSLQSQRGQTMVEFALVLPMLCLLLLGIAQLGIAFNNYVTVTDATRAGARKAAVSRRASNPSSATISAVRASAVNLNQSKLVVPTPTSTWQPGDDVTVCAKYPYDINLLGLVVKSGTLGGSSGVCTTERVQ